MCEEWAWLYFFSGAQNSTQVLTQQVSKKLVTRSHFWHQLPSGPAHGPEFCQIPKCMKKHKQVGGGLLKRGFYLLLWSSVLTPDSSPGHDNSAKLLFPSEPRPPDTKNTLETLTLSLFFPFFDTK